MELFSYKVLSVSSLYLDPGNMNFFKSEMDISLTGHEEDVEVAPSIEGENVCPQRPIE